MRVNIYAEEMTDRVEIVEKTNEEGSFIGIRFYLYMPTSIGEGGIVKGPFIHRHNDDDSSAVTFWGKRESLTAFLKAVELLTYYRGGRIENVTQNFMAAEPRKDDK